MQKHILRICAVTTALFTLCACGANENAVTAKMLSGAWIDDQGNALDIRPGEGQYTYCPSPGRMSSALP